MIGVKPIQRPVFLVALTLPPPLLESTLES